MPVAGLSLLAFLGATPVPASAAGGRFSYTGDAYGTRLSVGSTVKSGPTALVKLGCGTEAGVHKANTVIDVNLAPTGFTGTVRTTADTSSGPTQSRTTAETENVILLGGLVKADLVKAESTTTRDSTGFHVSADGSSFLNLVVSGHPELTATATPAANTTVDLPGLGSVVLNEQVSSVSKKKASLTVNMIHVRITVANLLGIEVGTEVIVSHAKSDLEGPVSAFLDGKAYGTSVKASNVVLSGPSALVSMPCLGTKGIVKTNEVLSVNVPDILTSGTVYDTAQGTVTDVSASGETTSTIQAVNLLGGLVTADVVKADAHASSDGTTPSFSDNGSSLLNLTVSGSAISADTPPNTKISLAGLGTLYIHRVIYTSTSIEVRMIELVVTQTNVYGLLAGTDVRIAVASASVH